MIIKFASCPETSRSLLWSNTTWKSQMFFFLFPLLRITRRDINYTWQQLTVCQRGDNTCSLHDRLRHTKSVAQRPRAVETFSRGLLTRTATLPNWRIDRCVPVDHSIDLSCKGKKTQGFEVVQKIGGLWPNQASSSALAGAKHVLWMMGFNKTGKDDDKLHRDLSLVLFRQAPTMHAKFSLVKPL